MDTYKYVYTYTIYIFSQHTTCINQPLCAHEFISIKFHMSHYSHIVLLIHFDAATRCNTLQQTAIHCSKLQHTATHCNTLQHTAAHCNFQICAPLVHLMFQITYTDTLTQKHTNPSPPPTTESSKIIFVTHIRDSAPHLGTTFFICCDIPPSHVWICVCVCVPRCVGVRMCVCAYVRLQACMRNDWLTCLTSVCVSSMVTSKKTKRKCKITMTWPWSWTAQQQQVGQDHLSNPPPPPFYSGAPALIAWAASLCTRGWMSFFLSFFFELPVSYWKRGAGTLHSV